MDLEFTNRDIVESGMLTAAKKRWTGQGLSGPVG